MLICEDGPDVLLVVNAIVGEFAEMDNAANLADARRMLRNNRYDLAILDISSGMELSPILNSAASHIPAMVFPAREMALKNMREANRRR